MNKKQPTIAQQLADKLVDDYKGELTFDPKDATYTFPDGSKAIAITSFVDCEPYQSRSLSTMAKKPVKHFKPI